MDVINTEKLIMVCVIVHYISITLILVNNSFWIFHTTLKILFFCFNFVQQISFIIIKEVACKNILHDLL